MVPPTNLVFNVWTPVTSHYRLRMFDRLAVPDPSTLAPSLLPPEHNPSEPMVGHIELSTNVQVHDAPFEHADVFEMHFVHRQGVIRFPGPFRREVLAISSRPETSDDVTPISLMLASPERPP